MFKPLNLIRTICLLIVLLGIGISWVYTERSSWVNAVDWHATKWYERSLGQELKGLKPRAYKGEEASRVARLDEIRRYCEGDVQGERRFAPWRIATELQVEALISAGDFDVALPVLESALRKNPRNLAFVFGYIEALIQVGESDGLLLAEDLILEWQRKIPSHPEIWSLRVLLESHKGDANAVAEVLRDRLPGTLGALRTRWQMFLFPEGKGKIVKSEPVDFRVPDESGRFVLDYVFTNPPKEIKMFRLDPPGYYPQRLVDLRVQLWVGDAEVPSELTSKWTGMSEASELPGGSLAVQIHQDPRLRMKLKGGGHAEAEVTVRVSGQLVPLLNLSAREALADPKFRSQVCALAGEAAVDLVSPLVTPGGTQ